MTNADPVDAFAQMIHIFQMLHPQVIKHLQINVALDFTHYIAAKYFFLVTVEFVGSGHQRRFKLAGFAVKKLVERTLVEWKSFTQDGFKVLAK